MPVFAVTVGASNTYFVKADDMRIAQERAEEAYTEDCHSDGWRGQTLNIEEADPGIYSDDEVLRTE